MIGKNNQNLKNKKEGVKIESYSIKKFKVGAASVVIGASIFFGATGIASANEIAASSDSSGVNNKNATPENGDKVPEEINTVSVKKESVTAEKKPSNIKEESTKVEVEKKVVDKSLLETSITKLEELLATVNKDKAPASTLSAVNIDLINAKSILEKANASQEEVDELVKKLRQQTQIVSSMPKVTNKKKEVKEGANSIANSGSHDSRNGQSMGEGTQFRSYTPSSSGALKNVKYYASVDPKDNGGRKTRNNEPEFTENKTVIKAAYEQNSSGKWMVYDIFFNNDGRAMVEQSYGQHYYFQPPFNIMDGSNRVENLTITRYRNVGGRRLSDGGSGFEKVGNTIVISNPWQQKDKIFDGDRRSLYDPNSGVSRSNQKPQVFKNNKDDGDLDKIVRKTDGNYTGGVSYTLGMEVGKVSTPYAIHMTARVKLKDNITEKDAANGNVYAASVTSARNTNQSYIVGSLGTSLTPKDTTPPTINANGATVTKNEKIVDIPVTAVDNTGGVGMRPNNPIEVTGLPQGLTYTNGKITGTPTGPVGNSTVTIKAYDKNGNKAEKTITITVKDQASKYNPTGETLTVNQGQPITDDAVKAKVKNYAPGKLSIVSKPSTAKAGNVGNAVVKVTYPDGSTENVNVPVTVLEAPDIQPPTLAITPANQTVVEGDKVTFTVTAKDNKVVNIDGSDFLKKYGTRITSGNATNTNVKTTDSEKVTTITITTSKEDVGKTNTITFNASDNAGNKAKPVTFTFNVTPRDTQKPEATLNGVRLTENANAPIFTVYRGATFNPELKVWDNSGVISKVTTGNLPYGITASTFTAQTGKTEKTPYTTRLSSGTVLNTQTLGDHIGTLHVEGSSATDSRDLKFKYRVVDIESKNLENGVAKVPVGSTLNVANSGKNIDAHNYLKVVDSKDLADRGNNYLPSGMTWTWKQGDKLEPGTTLDNSGKYTRNATAIFPSSVSDVNSTTRKTFAPVEIKRPVVLAVTPTAPSVVANENGTVTITPPTRPNSTTPQDIDTITLTYTPTGKTTPETVTVAKSGNNWTVNGKSSDKVSVTPAGVVTISDPEVADGKEVTAKVSKRIDSSLTLESPVAKEIAKGAKPQTPVAIAKDNGEVTAKPQDPAKADKITVSYIGEDNQPKTAVGKKDPKGNWTVDTPEVQINPKTGEITIPENKVKDGTEVTVVTKNGNSTDSDPAKAVAKDAQKPEATLNGVRLTENANTPIFTVYRGAIFNPELKVWDNTGIISKVEVKEGLPKGVTSSTFTSQTGKTQANSYATRLSSGTVLNTETLGVHESTLHVEGSSATDSRDFKFKYRVVDIETRNLENGIAKVPVGSTLNVANSGKNIDAHKYLKVVDSEDKADKGNNYLPSGMTWTWKQGDKLDPGTTLDNSGKYTRNATAIFPDTSKNSITDVNSTTRTTFAPTEIKRQVVLAITPTVPSIVGNEDGSATITPPTRPNSTNPQDIDTITITYTPTGKTTPETVTVTKSGNNWTVNGKSADKVSVTPAGVVTISDVEIADKTDITAKVSKRIDNNLTLESPVARGTANGPLAAEVTPPGPVLEKEKTTPVTVVTPNKPGTTITVDTPVNGLTVDKDGNLVGTPKVTDWGPKEEERKITIPVKVKKGDEEVRVDVPVTIQRDTDGDGIPDKVDTDDDNDGIPDTEDKNPKVVDGLTGETTGKTVKEKTPVPANTKVVTPNKPGTTITVDTPVNELTVDKDGNLVGKPKVTDWGPKEEERIVEIPVKLKRGTEEVVVKVPVNIERDTDGDGIPDKVDTDDDNDGIPDTEDKNLKVVDELTGETTGKTVKEKTPVPENTKVVTPNKPGTTITVDTPVNGLTVDKDGNLVGTPTITDWGPKEEERTVEIPVKLKRGTEEVVVKVPVNIERDTDGEGIPDKVDTDDDNDGIPDTEDVNPKVVDELTGKVTGKTVPEKTPVPTNTKVLIPNKPGTTITVDTPVNGLTVDKDGNLVGTPTVTDWGPKEEERTVEIPVKLKRGTEEVVVKVPVNIERDTDGDGIPDKVDSDDDNDGIPDTEEIKNGTDPKVVTTETPNIDITRKPNGDAIVTPKKPDGTTYPPGTKVVIPGDNNTPIEVTIGDNGSGEVPNDKLPKGDLPGKGTVTEPNKNPSKPVDVTTPARKTPTLDVEQNPNTGDVTVTPKRPDGSTYPPGTKVEIPGKDKDHPITVTIGEDGKGTVPNNDLPDGKVPGTGKITEPGKPTEEVPNVETPSKIIPGAPTTEQPVEIEITRKPNGDAVVTPKKPDGSTYPPGTKVEIPGKDKNDNPITITVTIGDNGSGEVPNDNLPKKDLPGTGTVTEPNKNPSKPVDVTTPARKTPTLDVEQNPNTGDVTVTPKRPDGSTYPPGTKVEILGKNGNTITVTIGEDGKGTVPNSDLPEGKVPGIGKITEPGKPTEEVPNVETPARKTPTLDVEQDPKTGDVTVTPKRPDGSTYPPGTKVEIPGKDKDHPITVTIGEDGKGTVPNNDLPDGKVPGTGKITEPGKPTEEVPNVETPSKIIPGAPTTEQPVEIEITRKPNGDAIVTPKKPDGSTYPPGTKVVIPGDNNTPIEVTIGDNGSGEVPNDKLPKGDLPGTGTVTEPNKNPSKPVDVTTPAKLTPTVELEQNPNTGDVTVTPKKPDGSTYPPGTKVEIPGKNGNTITVTIGEDGKGTVPNSDLPDVRVPGVAKITEPGKPTVEVPVVTTPAKLTPTVELEQNPNTGDVTVTPKKPDGSTYPPGTKVEIPGKNGNTITVTIGEDGKGTVPNSDLPDVRVPGVAKITEPGKPTVEVPVVTTPAKLTPTVEVSVVTTPAKIRASEKGELQSQKSSDNKSSNNKENSIANKSTKRLANTGESETNTGLAGLGLAMLGSLLAVAKKRREDKE